MQKVPIELVKPGMVLARPITNDAGMALCAEGTELSENIIERLMQMNVSHVTLKGHPVDFGGETKTKEQKVRGAQGKVLQGSGGSSHGNDPFCCTKRSHGTGYGEGG